MAKKVRTKVKEIELDEFAQFLMKFQSVLNRGNRNKDINNVYNFEKNKIQKIEGDQNYGN